MALGKPTTSIRICIFVLIFTIIIFHLIQPVSATQCYCTHCPEYKQHRCTVKGPDGECFASINDDRITRGCFGSEGSAFFQCKATVTKTSYVTCCQGELCNEHIPVQKKALEAYLNKTDSKGAIITHTYNTIERKKISVIVMVISVCFCFMFLFSVTLFLLIRHRIRKRGIHLYLGVDKGNSYTDSELTRYLDQTESSGSGSGLPLMVQRTIARQINMIESVGKGRYGEVWRGRWRSSEVAVKVFYSTEEASWRMETELYNTHLLRHDNILGFIASDIKGTGSWTQLFLITEYHPNGSLYDYLRDKVTSLDTHAMLLMAHSTICGISHLHTEIHGTKGKSAMAHRDIKSKNILVKSNGQCCIADLGLAITYNSEGFTERTGVQISGGGGGLGGGGSENRRTGTKRYMSPEVLSQSLQSDHFESYKQSDMYSFALVLWELARCTTSFEKALEYEEPYYDCVKRDPSFDDMHRVVCEQKLRPVCESSWGFTESMKGMTEIMQECWDGDQTVRLTALRAQKKLLLLLENSASSSTSSSDPSDSASSLSDSALILRV